MAKNASLEKRLTSRIGLTAKTLANGWQQHSGSSILFFLNLRSKLIFLHLFRWWRVAQRAG